MANQGYIGRAPGDSSVIIARQDYTASGVTTDFTFNSGYTVGYLDVYLNGTRLLDATDYTATDGSIVSLTEAAQDQDVLELVAYKAFNVGNVTNAIGNFTVGGNLTVDGTMNGNGSTLTGIDTGVSINAAGGALQRVMLGNVTSGVAHTMASTGSLYWNNTTSTLYASNVNVSGTMTQEDVQNVDSTGIVTAGRGFRATLGGVVVTAGVSTFTPYPAIDANEEVQVGASIQLGKAGIVTALGLDISTSGVDIDGQTDLDELQVAGVATFSAAVDVGTGGLDVDGQTDLDELVVAGVATFSAAAYPSIDVDGQANLDEVAVAGVATFGAALNSSDIRIKNVAEESTILAGNTVDLNWGTNGNVAICTTPTGDVTLRVNSIPTSGFDNQNITFSAIVASSGTARTCTAVKLNGVNKTILWAGGSLEAATDGLTTSMGYIVQSFTGINTIGSGSTTANYQLLGVISGSYDA